MAKVEGNTTAKGNLVSASSIISMARAPRWLRDRHVRMLRYGAHARLVEGLKRGEVLVDRVSPPNRPLWYLRHLLHRYDRRVICVPDLPPAKSALSKILAIANVGIDFRADLTASVGREGLIVRFRDATRDVPSPGLLAASRTRRIVNMGWRDISKRNVAVQHREVFGYDAHVDPGVHAGPIVMKPDDNCAGPVVLLDGPLACEPREGVVYQRFVAEVDDKHSRDYRIYVFGGEIRLVRVRWWGLNPNNLKSKCVKSVALSQGDVFSPYEVQKIQEFCERMGCELAELDAVRDPGDGRIYVLDVTTTPSGPSRGMTQSEQVEFLRVLTEHFFDAYGSAPGSS
jgi:hypothetical protein